MQEWSVLSFFSTKKNPVAKGEEDGRMIPAFVDAFLHGCRDNQWGEEHQVGHPWHSCMICGEAKKEKGLCIKPLHFGFSD